MSASSHTRGHRFAGELTGAVLAWLESYERLTLNGSRALQLELSKAGQYGALRAHGIAAPRTVAAVGREAIVEASRSFSSPFIVKHNRGGKGLGVRLVESTASLGRYLDSADYDAPVDGVTLVQEYIEPASPHITRLEFIGGELLYAVRVDTRDGFELCPADICQASEEFCPAGATEEPRFEIDSTFDSPLVARLQGFLEANDIAVAAAEVIEDRSGRAFVYDVNTNTNYNRAAEARAGVSGMMSLALFLGRALEQARKSPASMAFA